MKDREKNGRENLISSSLKNTLTPASIYSFKYNTTRTFQK